MPRLKTTRIKTKVLPRRLAAKRREPNLQPLTDFEDIAVYFSKEEWQYLDADQIDLYRQVMIDNYQTFCSLGYQNEKPTLISKIEQDEDLYITELEKYSEEKVRERKPLKNLQRKFSYGKIVDAPRFNKEELNTSLSDEKLAVKDIHLTSGLENGKKISTNEEGSLPPKHQYNFRDRAAVEYTIFYDDEGELRKLKPHKNLRRKSSFSKIVDAPRFNTQEQRTSLLPPEELTVKDLHLIGHLENCAKPLSNGDASLPSRRQYNFRDRVSVEYTMFDDTNEVKEHKPEKNFQKKSSYGKIVDTPIFKTEALHTSLLSPKELVVEEKRITNDLENCTKLSSNENGSLLPKRQYNFRDRVAVEYGMFYDDEEEVRELKSHKRVQKKLSYEKTMDAPRFNTAEQCTSLLAPKELAVENIHFTGHLAKRAKTSSNKNGSLPSKRQYYFRDRVAVEYTMSYEDEVRELKPHKSLQRTSSYAKIQPKCGKYTCSECGKSYSQKPSLMKHQKIHTGISIYVCSKCDKCFTQRSNLKRHERSHTVEKPCVCSYCGKGFTESSSLHKHQRIHTGLKPFACSECDKTFSISTYLIVHQRTHTGEKPYVCPDCGKSFTQSSSLITHQRTHTGVKPYGCIECGKGFSTSSHLITHQRTHTGERPYPCGECGMAFKHSTHLVLHKRKHTGERPYSCTKCPRTFAQRPQLVTHQHKRHAYE